MGQVLINAVSGEVGSGAADVRQTEQVQARVASIPTFCVRLRAATRS
jgi:hypothetical protein